MFDLPPEFLAFLVLAAFLWLCWLADRLLTRLCSERCPRCRSKWRTEALGEWDGHAAWICHGCCKYWTIYYWKPRP